MISNIKNKINGLLRDSDFNEIFRGSSISFILRITGLAIGYLLTFFIARKYGADSLGEYVLAITVLKIFVVFGKLGIDTTAIRFFSSFATKKRWYSILKLNSQMIQIITISSILSSFLMYFLSHQISEIVNIDSSILQLLAFFVTPMSLFVLHYQSLRGLKKIAMFSFFFRVSITLFTLIILYIIHEFFLIEDAHQYNVPLYAFLISILIVSILSFFSMRYAIYKNISYDSLVEKINDSTIIKISIPLMFAQSAQFIMSWTDKLMLGAIKSPNVVDGLVADTKTEVGIYHAAFRLSMFAAISLMAINSIAAPKFAEMYSRNDLQGLKKVSFQSTKLIFWTTLPLLIIFFMFPEFILGLFGPQFAQYGVSAFILLSIGRFVSSISGSVGNILQMTGNQNIYFIILSLGAILNIGLNFILIPKYGILGAAIATMSSLIFWNLTMVLFIKKKFGFFTFYLPFIRL
ncbi:MAG: hypothetical protein CMP51_04340 [Flavobacteriales bacterium]|nr:hypothetical protein [Flavobacteriales bacterium]